VDKDLVPGSERGFGIVFAVVFLLLALFPLLGGGTPFYWAFGLAAAFLLLAFVWPRALAPLNLVWFKFGLLLHRIVSPVIMTLLYFVAVTPTGLVMRLFGKNLLRLRKPAKATSYWIERRPPGPEPASLRNQF